MRQFLNYLYVLCAALAVTPIIARPHPQITKRNPPTVTLDSGSFEGVANTTAGTNAFLGIPFASAERFHMPVANSPYSGIYNATAFGDACPQQTVTSTLAVLSEEIAFGVLGVTDLAISTNEDCLTINVYQPAGISSNAKLPVLVWIYGGGFEVGASSGTDGTPIVEESVKLGTPILYVSLNYRLSAFGFLASQEVLEAGVSNIGLQDQREALRWVQKYISAFGGDPTKVTIWGESAGAISVGTHMIANGGDNEGLFRAAIMQSGSPISVANVTNNQNYYNALVAQTGCQESADTLDCLRQAPFEDLQAAMDASPFLFSPNSLNMVWSPRVDGTFITDNPQQLVLNGIVANVPFITGDVDDEGTLFSLDLVNYTTDEGVKSYLASYYLPTASDSDLNQLLELYPQNLTEGSPFDTGFLNAITPQYKRLAAIQGDLIFQGPRRLLLQERSGKQNAWSYLSKRMKMPLVGSAHQSDILLAYDQTDLTDYIVNFVNTLNPNGGSLANWPQYSVSSPQLLTLLDGATPVNITLDSYRADGMSLLQKLALTAH
ncbi:hypothetical protein NM688_g4916 [Phlebia brevispora]|uniref:Uncharacterized protein n=1 Tax=Phlebia brevispora TaxID=194682 RepID=A0ACC1T1N8_9APHY|nr:hypothetical protein NM688_g4916 [Phlebia brevispora]